MLGSTPLARKELELGRLVRGLGVARGEEGATLSLEAGELDEVGSLIALALGLIPLGGGALS